MSRNAFGRVMTGSLIIGALSAMAAMQWDEALAELKIVEPPRSSAANSSRPPPATSRSLGVGCFNPKVVDGDTLRCGSTRIRLHAIDAPEMPGHCRPGRQCTPGDPYASTDHLKGLVSGRPVSCRKVDTDRYGRIVALCEAGGHDLSCEQVRTGHAAVRYGTLSC